MNRSNLLNFILPGLLVAASVSGCKKTPVAITPIPGPTTGLTGGGGTAPPIGPGTKLGPGEGPGGENIGTIPLAGAEEYQGMLKDKDQFKDQTIYFDFDKSVIKPSEKSKLDAVAAYMKNDTQAKVLIEGHCDERGTDEYNRALGERRALAAREYLVNSGLAADHLFTISYGKDRPAVQGHDEAAWSKNRRDEFDLLKARPGGTNAPASTQ